VSSVAGIIQDEAIEMDGIIRPPPKASALEGIDTFDAGAVKSKGREVKQVVEDIPDKIGTSADGKTDAIPESAQRIRVVVVDRIKAVRMNSLLTNACNQSMSYPQTVVQAQSDRAYETALATIFDLLHKYVGRTAELSVATKNATEQATEPLRGSLADATPLTIEMNSELNQTITLFQKFLDRFGTGIEGLVLCLYLAMNRRLTHHARRRILQSWRNLVDHEYADPIELEDYLFSISLWLRRATSTPQWASSEQGSTELGQLYDRGRVMLEVNPDLQNIMSELLSQAEVYVNAMKADKSANRLAGAFDRLNQDAKDLGFTGMRIATGQKEALRGVRQELWQDAHGWLLPRLLRVIKAIPMPRLEYTSKLVDAVIDDLVLTAPSFVPDHIFINNTNTIHVMGSAALDKAIAIGEPPQHRRHPRKSAFDPKVSLASATRLRIDGLRISAKLISYFVEARYGILRWTDNGLLGFDIGNEADPRLEGDGSEGLSADIELKTAQPDARSFFEVQDVSIDMPGLVFRIARSRHWFVNAVLTPIISPLVRRVGGRIAASETKRLLTALDKLAFNVHERAIQNTQSAHSRPSQRNQGVDEAIPSIGAYWSAFLEVQAEWSTAGPAAAADEDSPTIAESEVHATARGITRTTRVEGPNGQVKHESATAAGIGAQLLPGRGGPNTTRNDRDMGVVVEEADEALDEVQDVAEAMQQRALDATTETQEAARTTKDRLERSVAAYEQGKKKEGRRYGWRSDAFDL
jgi:hypothetical protein